MRSRAARFTLSAVAWVAIAAAGYFLVTSEQQLSSQRTALRAFDQQARETAAALADLRAGQQAYVAAGQGVAFWMPKVDVLIKRIAGTVDVLRASATTGDGRQPLVEAAAAIAELNALDRRARDYIRGGEQLMASDVVFTEGSDAGATVTHQVELSRLAEYRAFDQAAAELRRLEGFALGGAAGFAALVMALLALAPGPAAAHAAPGATTGATASTRTPAVDLPLRHAPATAASQPAAAVDRSRGSNSGSPEASGSGVSVESNVPSNGRSHGGSHGESNAALRDAAALCTGFGCVKDAADLTRLLAQSARLMDATGLIVWLGDASGGDLRPLLAHGYSEQALARMPPVPRLADNAAAAAYRTGSLQIVNGKSGHSSGALVAPLLAVDGCIGALTAEIRDSGETSDHAQAIAAIVAAQLAGVLAASVTAVHAGTSQTAAASGRVVSA